MIRLLYWVYRRSASIRRLLARRLTPAGGFVFSGLFLVSFLAANPGQTVAYQTWFLLAVLLLVASVYAPFFRLDAELTRALPRFGTVGESLRYRVRLKHRGRRRQVGLVYGELFDRAEPDLRAFGDRLRPGRRSRHFQLSVPMVTVEVARARPQSVPELAGGGEAEFTAELVPLRRGTLEFSGAWVGRADPLGLIRSTQWIRLVGSVTVLPRRYPVAVGSLPGATQYQHGGVAYASGVGESEEFVGVREYRRGDSLRKVHWRVSARLGRPAVREYQDEFFMRHALVLDTFCDASMDDVFEEAVSVASSFAYTVPEQDALLDLLFVGPKTVCVTTGRGVGHAEHMLEVLACARPCRESRFAELEDLVLRHSARMSGCLLVLLDWDEDRRALVRQLKALRVPVWVLRVSPPGEDSREPLMAAGDRPDRWVSLEMGRIGETLREL